MNNLIAHGMGGYNAASAMIINKQVLWEQIIIDNADGTKIINVDGTLRHEDERQIMDKLVEIRRRQLNGVTDLMAAGLSFSEDLGTMLVGRENINEFQAAERSMNPTSLQNNQTDFELEYNPLPLIFQGWRIPFRQTGFSYKQSIGMAESVRQVSESAEDMLFNGAPEIKVNIGGSVLAQIFGYTTFPDRETFTISDWTDLATNADKIVPETLKMVGLAFTNGAVSRPNSLMMYVANDIWTNLQDDYSSQKGDRTFAERLKAISEISDIKPGEFLTDGNVVLVEMSDRTIELAVASDIVTVPHLRRGPLEDQTFTTYAAMVPIIKSDRNNKSGIVHGSP